MAHLLNDNIHLEYDIIAIQEPALNFLNNPSLSPYWRSIYPMGHKVKMQDDLNRDRKLRRLHQLVQRRRRGRRHSPSPAPLPPLDPVSRSLILVNASLDTNSYALLTDIPSLDVTAMQLHGNYGKLTLFNIYNDGKHSDTLDVLSAYMGSNPHLAPDNDSSHVIWLGDFNCHHPDWDVVKNKQLFTPDAVKAADILLTHVSHNGLLMALPLQLTTALQDTIREVVPVSTPLPFAKRWWTSDLTKLRVQHNQLSRRSYRMRDFPNHECHAQFHMV
ncbi:hypothetical protein EVG20_g11197 [Dentipellis fragilis]|uniref:Endonuclease/exonuclease/phosphatase domain-containing protein n=1 Tax=Dentipellis fragilis TaxID=205917 RepID=A0A4Y9XR70_9AGAM|nr:hypothetical protein EVG20_g11197 [Dentipellis fragilis]